MSAGTNTQEEAETQVSPDDIKRRDGEKTGELLKRYEEMLIASQDKDTGKAPPEATFVFREKEDWSELGWTNENKENLKRELSSVFRLKPEALESALEIIVASAVASRKRPEDVLSKINRDEYRKFEAQFLQKNDKNSERDAKLMFFSKSFSTDETGAVVYIEPEEKEQNDPDGKMGLNLDEDYVMRFILYDEFHDKLRAEAYGQIPENIYETAWQIAFNQQEEFGLHGKFPILQMQLEDIKDEKGNVTGQRARYRVNQANWVRWIRYWINHHQEQSPDDVTNYFNEVKIPNKQQYSEVSISTMLGSQATFFRDEDGHDYQKLWDETLMEPWMLMTIRQYDIEYKQVMGSEEELAKAINKMFFLNTLTKNTYSKSMMYYMTTLGLDYQGEKTDTSMGSAWTKMFMAYYNLSDFQELQNTLGEDSSFFTRSGMEKAMRTVVEDKYKQTKTANTTIGSFMGSDTMQNFEKAFKDKNGVQHETIQDQEAFTKFVNHFAQKRSNANWVKVIKTALMNTVEETQDFKTVHSNKKKSKSGEDFLVDHHSLELAHLIAFSWQRFTGAAARNDVDTAGYDSATKWYYTELYRRKMATPERAGSSGNPYTFPFFKGSMVDFMRGIRVSEAEVSYGKDKDGKDKMRKLTPLEIFVKMQESMKDVRRMQSELNKLEKQNAPQEQIEQLKAQIEELTKISDKKYKETAGQLEFTDNTMRNYAGDHVDRCHKIYSQIMKADSINFDKFTKYDLYRGISFDRSAFQEEVQDKFLKPLRYLWETNGDMNFNMKVRYPVFTGRDAKNKDKKEYKEMTLGEALFGYQILNIPEFRKTELTEEDEGKNLKKKGKYYINEDGRYEIDYNKVQENQTLAWKQWAAMKFAGDLWSHLNRHSTDPAYDLKYYLNIIDTLANIPAEIQGDDSDLKKVKVVNAFFDKKQMRWMRDVSNTSNFRLFMKGLAEDIGSKVDEGGLSRSTSLFIGAIFRGY